MINVVKLIFEVKQRPVLWDLDEPKYMNCDVKNKCWEEVTAIVLPVYLAETSELAKDRMVKSVRRRWKSVRDYYKKHLKAPNDQRKYVFAELLTFLDPHINRLEKPFRRQHAKKANDSDENVDDADSEDDVTVHNQRISEPMLKKKRITKRNTDPLDITETVDNEDPDKLFLLSFLGHLKALNESDKIEFKIQMLNTLKEFNNSKSKPRE